MPRPRPARSPPCSIGAGVRAVTGAGAAVAVTGAGAAVAVIGAGAAAAAGKQPFGFELLGRSRKRPALHLAVAIQLTVRCAQAATKQTGGHELNPARCRRPTTTTRENGYAKAIAHSRGRCADGEFAARRQG